MQREMRKSLPLGMFGQQCRLSQVCMPKFTSASCSSHPSWDSPQALVRRCGNAAPTPSPAAGACASAWRGRCTYSRQCCCWTSRRITSTSEQVDTVPAAAALVTSRVLTCELRITPAQHFTLLSSVTGLTATSPCLICATMWLGRLKRWYWRVRCLNSAKSRSLDAMHHLPWQSVKPSRRSAVVSQCCSV